jgi:spore germination protein YaaH
MIYRLLAISFIAFLSSCSNKGSTLNNSVRRNMSQIQSIKNQITTAGDLITSSGIGSLAEGLEGKKDSTDSAYPFATIEQKNLLNNYSFLYDMINGQGDSIRANNIFWDSVQKVFYKENKKFKRIQPNKEVFGWHPYWMGEAWRKYPFELLTTVSFFSYVVDPNTGSYLNPQQISDWRKTEMIDSAKVKGTKMLLSVSNQGKSKNDLFLGDSKNWETLADSLAVLVLDRDADGVDLNFEGIPYLKRGTFNRFVKTFRQLMDLKVTTKTPIITLTLPAYDNREMFDVVELQKYVDRLVIMGYDYNGSTSKGPVAPLRAIDGGVLSIENTVDYYLNTGIDPVKTIFALPYYGNMWTGKFFADGTTSSSFKRKVTYREIMNIFKEDSLQKIRPFLNDESMTNYYNIVFADSTSTEIWYDDDYTLGKKYDYVMSNEFKGVGIWALGYDNGYDQLWDEISSKFATEKQVFTNPIAEIEGYPYKVSAYLLKYKNVIFVISVFLLFAIVIGLTISLTDYNVRDSIAKNRIHSAVFIGIIYVLLTPIIYAINEVFFLKSTWTYYATFLVGALAFYLASKIKIDDNKRP